MLRARVVMMAFSLGAGTTFLSVVVALGRDDSHINVSIDSLLEGEAVCGRIE